MTWIKLDDAYPEHRKLKRAGDLRAFCIALDIAGMCFCGRFNTDGFIGDDDLPGVLEVLPVNRRQVVLAKLVTIGRWDRDGERGGYWVRNYLGYNPSAARREQIAKAGRERAQASRLRSRERNANADRTDSGAPPNVRRNDGEGAVTPSPSPSPSPLSTDVVPFLTVIGTDPTESKQTEGEGKGRTPGRPPRTPRHPTDEFVINRARQIQAQSGIEAARAYIRTVGQNYGQASREDQLRRLDAMAAQDAAEAGEQ